jgi:hypothetical protein
VWCAVRWQKPCFHSSDRSVSASPPCIGGVFSIIFSWLTCVAFSSLLFLGFHVDLLKIQISPWNLFSLRFDPYYLDFKFFMKLELFLVSSLLDFFHMSDLVHIPLIAICFFKMLFYNFFTISSFLSFFFPIKFNLFLFLFFYLEFFYWFCFIVSLFNI